MLRGLLSGTIVLLAGSAMAIAAPKDDVTAAAQKLSEANNYSWKQTSPPPAAPANGDNANGGRRRGRGGFGFGGPVEGKVADGYVMTSFGTGDTARESISKGDKTVIKTQDGWQTPEEIRAAADANGNGNGGRRGRGGFMGGARAPGGQAATLAKYVGDLKEADGAYQGDLSEEGAKGFLMGGGRRGGNGNGPEISDAKGTAKFWVKDGNLTKFEYHVTGTISFNGNDRPIDRTVTVEISDVGSTKIAVPDDAKKKLES
ncbi:MAG TPA: hypothetical protein VFW23_06380 [Tepidisphaeraceae bacterium]|nr:hypothetical protein [Tepidisphaeraceae bacterium]